MSGTEKVAMLKIGLSKCLCPGFSGDDLFRFARQVVLLKSSDDGNYTLDVDYNEVSLMFIDSSMVHAEAGSNSAQSLASAGVFDIDETKKQAWICAAKVEAFENFDFESTDMESYDWDALWGMFGQAYTPEEALREELSNG